MAEPPESDRRTNDRRLVCAVAEIESVEKSSLALIRNVSEAGALLLSARSLEIGDEVELCIHTTSDPDGPKIVTRGQVVRRDPIDASRADLWRWQLGVRFFAPLEGCDEQLGHIAAQLRR
jgi:hypothetical protein